MKIGELATITATRVDTIRYYEREGLLPKPMRTESNYRTYDASHIERLAFIRRCRSLDMSLSEIGQLLQFKDSPSANCAEVNQLLDEHIGHVSTRIKELRNLEKQLKNLRECCHEVQAAAHCGILNGLSQPLDEALPNNKSHVHRVHTTNRRSKI